VFTDRSDAVVMVSVGRRQWRPKQAQPAMWQPVVDGAPLRLRCTARHQWSRTRAELLDAYRVADERGLRDITLGAEFFAV
jgi:hypothetical protein